MSNYPLGTWETMLVALRAVDRLWSANHGDLTLDFEKEKELGTPVGVTWAKVREAIAKAEGRS